MPTDTYLGISKTYSSELKASGSKFYGFLFPVKDEVDFEEKIKEFKAQYADATHVCSACVIGVERDYQRFSDDGEPSNSSGRPILHALLFTEASYIACAVVRYYGGKKLGIPGLIESYGGAAQMCTEQARFATHQLKAELLVSMDPAKSYLLYNFVARNGDIEMESTPDGKFILRFPKSMTDELQKELTKIVTLAIE